MKNNARSLAMELENIVLKIDEAYEESKNEMSRLDLMRQDVLHYIEGNTFNASEGYKYSKALQLISKERRQLKYEHEELELLRARTHRYSKQILKSAEETRTISMQNDIKRENGYRQYKPRVLGSLDKNDILNQVLQILNSEE